MSAQPTALQKASARPFRNGSLCWWRNLTGHDTGCFICGEPLPGYDRGRPHWIHGGRMTCSNKCRQKAYRVRKRETERREARS